MDEQLAKHRDFGIDATILQPASCHDIESVREQHDRIAELTRQYPGRYYGMANPNPHLKDVVYETEVRRCVEEPGFVGIKIHTFAHAVIRPDAPDAKCSSLPASSGPSWCTREREFRSPTPRISLPWRRTIRKYLSSMAHCGMMIMAGETAIAMRTSPNLYADITWTAGFQLKHWAQKFGAQRFMFGTDHADNAGTELAKVRTCGLSEEDQEWVLHKSARSVYSL